MKLGYLIYTFDRVWDARIQMEIVRSLWEKTFGKVYLVHAYNGKKKWYPKKYLEDKLIRQNNPGHYEGAANLIDAGMKELLKHNLDWLVISASDTWLIKPGYIQGKIKRMAKDGNVFFACPWGTPTRNDPRDLGISADFFVLRAGWEMKNKMFPARYGAFKKKYLDLARYLGARNISYEKLLFARFVSACAKEDPLNNNQLRFTVKKRLLLFEERMPIHKNENWDRFMQWPKIGLYTDHELKSKKKMLAGKNLILGVYSKKLIDGK